MKILFIINPVSGKLRRDKAQWQRPVENNFPQADITFTQRPAHATELAAQAVKDHYEIFVVGGDGTINEVARALVGTQTALGIIPKGSGNGLARELGIALHYEEALAAMQKATPQACDVGKANDEYFFNLAGVGIEAEIARGVDAIKHGASVFRFRPMSSQLRRYIHRAVENNEYVHTASEGEGKWRKVTFRPTQKALDDAKAGTAPADFVPGVIGEDIPQETQPAAETQPAQTPVSTETATSTTETAASETTTADSCETTSSEQIVTKDETPTQHMASISVAGGGNGRPRGRRTLGSVNYPRNGQTINYLL